MQKSYRPGTGIVTLIFTKKRIIRASNGTFSSAREIFGQVLGSRTSAKADVRYILNSVNLIKGNTQVNPVCGMFLNWLILKILFW
jgi:hypothetical protein